MLTWRIFILIISTSVHKEEVFEILTHTWYILGKVSKYLYDKFVWMDSEIGGTKKETYSGKDRKT